MLTFLKRKNTPRPYPLIVCGAGISACTAVLFAAQKNIRTLWLTGSEQLPAEVSTTNTIQPHSKPFDSLSPEGMSYLRGILEPEHIAQIALGTFDGVTRNGDYTVFDSILGAGIHLNSATLKVLLCEHIQLHSCVTISPEQATIYTTGPHAINVTTNANKTYQSQWLINGQGEHSKLAKQTLSYLTDDIWVERFIEKEKSNAHNSAEFTPTQTGWQWRGIDTKGNACITRWDKNAPASTSSSAPDKIKRKHNSYNAKWYKRARCIETEKNNPPRALLIGTTFFRFDPSAGLGLTTQLKAALQAVRCVEQALNNPPNSEAFVKQFEYHMESSFNDIALPLADMYRGYGLGVNLQKHA